MANGQLPATPQDALDIARNQLFLLMTGQQVHESETPQLGRVQFQATTTADMQRLIDYLEGLVANGNTWPDASNPGGGSMTAGNTTGRKPFSIFGWP
jgi:hypothetical protein